ncbi:hypothetical protein CCMSSC00406_0007610 [Pleurotus cornucopiae]|uniref:Uncharacterized protein n=1 Tax=Pleurotus cornucopiae TaxID=5321 RepID=A0ACB7J1J5_PLECO|nr:hypothetical protein CCMSSC00406_0007610 [Pleurotus cornucopiae]
MVKRDFQEFGAPFVRSKLHWLKHRHRTPLFPLLIRRPPPSSSHRRLAVHRHYQNDSQIPLSSPLPSYNQLPGQHHVPQPSKNVDAATVHVQRHSPIVSHPVPPHNHSPLRTIDDIVHHLAPHHQVIITDTPTGRQDQANSIRSPHAQFCAGIIAANTLHRISFAF